MNQPLQQPLPVSDAPVAVKPLSAADMPRWDAFVSQAAQATFFHRAGWKTVIEKAFGHQTHFLLAESDGVIRGVLPLARIKSALFGHSLSALPFCVYGGIVADSEAAFRALDEAAQALAAKLDVDFLEYRSVVAQHSDWLTKDLYVTFRKTIQADHDANMSAIPRKQRAMVRKGIKAGLHSTFDDDIDRFFHAYASSVRNLGTPVFSRKYFALLREVFGKDCDVLTITKDDTVIASVLNFYFRDTVLPYYGGGTSASRDVAGNDFMYWELMRHSVDRGYRVFDYGRSKRGTGAFDFKKNWGFEPEPLQYEYKLYRASNLPDNSPLNPKYRAFINLWRKLPLPVANAIGPHIVKYLG